VPWQQNSFALSATAKRPAARAKSTASTAKAFTTFDSVLMAHTIAVSAAKPATYRHKRDFFVVAYAITKKSNGIGLPYRPLDDDSLPVFSENFT